jgi:tetratricopeptide (TPR) repeat protein
MGFRVRRSVKIMPGVRMTFSPSGVSTSIGVRGARVTRGANGRISRTIGIPGTGMSQTSTIRSATHSASRNVSHTGTATVPVAPTLFAPSYEKDFYKAKRLDTVQEYQRVITLYPETRIPGSLLLALKFIEEKQYPLALQALEHIWVVNDRIESDPLFRKYLALKTFEIGIAEGVAAQLNLDRDCIGLLLAETLQSQGEMQRAIEVVEDLYPTQTTALSLADLYVAEKRWSDVIEVSNGITNVDDATCLLIIYRGIAFRELGFLDAAKESFKEALKSKKRSMVVRHRGHAERALTLMTEGKSALALKEVQKIMAENPNDEGVKLILSALEVENLKPINPQLGELIDDELNLAENNELPDADWYPDPMNQDEFRFWNGTEWTGYVSNNGVVSENPL